MLGTELCGTPQCNTAIKNVRKIKQETDLKIKAQPSSPDPDLSAAAADFIGAKTDDSFVQPEKAEHNNQRSLTTKQNMRLVGYFTPHQLFSKNIPLMVTYCF